MEKILVVGANTRSVACSAKKAGYYVYSVDYFCTKDLIGCSDSIKCVLSQKPYESCGIFEDKFEPLVLENLSSNFMDKADFILCCAGVLPEKFPKAKIVGNKKIKNIENKYKLYKKLKKKFKVPKTFLISDFEEASEIVENEGSKFVIKPIFGSGGIGIREFEDADRSKSDKMIIQELIDGENISASVLSTGNEAKTIFTSKQLIGKAELGRTEPFGYCGNIVPYLDDPYIKKIAEDVIETLSLVGSNGVDMIHKGSDVYVVEVNPRFQGTFECAEAVLGINMVDAHIKACNGTLIDTNFPDNFAVKMIVFAKERSIVGDMNFDGVYDIPRKNVIIEKGEPVATVVSTGKVLEEVIYSAKKTVRSIYRSLSPFAGNNI